MAAVRMNGEYDLNDDRWNDKYPQLGTEPIPREDDTFDPFRFVPQHK